MFGSLKKFFKPGGGVMNEVSPNLKVHDLIWMSQGTKHMLSDGLSCGQIKTTPWEPVRNPSGSFKFTEDTESPRMYWFSVSPGWILKVSKMLKDQGQRRQRH